MTLPPEEVAALKTKYGALQQLTLGSATLVIRKPSRIEYRRARGLINDGKMEQAIESMASCVVWPDAAAVDALIDQQPALETKITDAVFGMAGLNVQVEKKDL